jgi:hypothetical protein
MLTLFNVQWTVYCMAKKRVVCLTFNATLRSREKPWQRLHASRAANDCLDCIAWFSSVQLFSLVLISLHCAAIQYPWSRASATWMIPPIAPLSIDMLPCEAALHPLHECSDERANSISTPLASSFPVPWTMGSCYDGASSNFPRVLLFSVNPSSSSFRLHCHRLSLSPQQGHKICPTVQPSS